jgi:hypothetical protein
MEHRDEQQPHGLAEIEQFPRPGEYLADIPQVCRDHRDVLVVAHPGLGVTDHDGVVVDIDDTGVLVTFLSDLIRVRTGREPGADVEKLADARIPQEPDRADQEGAVLPRRHPHLGHVLQPDLSHLPVGGEVVLAPQDVVIDTRRVRDVRANAK